MRMILVGVMVAAVTMMGPAVGGVAIADDNPPASRGDFNYANPSGQVIVEHEHGAGADFGVAIASSVLSILYHPVRMVYGIVGAELGGIVGWTTGGDMRSAKSVWGPTTEGNYFVRPDYLYSTERFHHGRQHVQAEPVETRVVAPEPVVAEAPAPAPVDMGDTGDTGDEPL